MFQIFGKIRRFLPDLFSRRAPNDLGFVILFVKSRGNGKEMERELGISHWTIRSRQNEIMGDGKEVDGHQRKNILLKPEGDNE